MEVASTTSNGGVWCGGGQAGEESTLDASLDPRTRPDVLNTLARLRGGPRKVLQPAL